MTCPNCGASGADNAAECASCGVVFVKWKPRSERAASAPEPGAPWSPRAAALWMAAAGLAVALFVVRDRARGALWLLDGVDLGVHETGHLVFGVLGLGNRFIMVAGGTIGQLLMPAAFWWDFRRRGQPRSADACLVWVGQNLLNIGKYAADARAQQLELVAGGVHDWTYMLEVTGLLIHDIGVGRCFDFAGCCLMAYAAARIVRATWPSLAGAEPVIAAADE